MSKLTYLGLALALVAICYAGQTRAQRFAPGYCPTVAAHENFDKTKFFGNWIEVEKTPSIFDLMMRCLVVDYSDDQDNTVNVVVRGVSLAGLPLTVNGDGLLQDVHRSGFYSIRYGFGVPFQGTLTTILDTDYDDYAVVYSCTNSLLSGVFHSEYIWVLSRSGKISNPTRQNIYEKLDKLGINRSGLTMSDRSTCPANSSTVARESDKDLAGQMGGSGAQLAPVAGGPAPADAASSQPVANLEKAGQEPIHKSVVVPLLFDLPSPASSSSVGASKPSAAKAPPAPVENKVPQLPVSSSVSSSQLKQQQQQQPQSPSQSPSQSQQGSPSKPAQAAASASAPGQPVSGAGSAPGSAPASASGSVADKPAQSAGSPVGGQQASKPSSQQPAQQSLLAKIQQKP